MFSFMDSADSENNSFPDNATEAFRPIGAKAASNLELPMHQEYPDSDDSSDCVTTVVQKAPDAPVWSDSIGPVELLRATPEGKFEIIPEGRTYLVDNVGNRPLIVIAVCGQYRTGKSYLLNLLAGRVGRGPVFPTGSTVNACTSGIWAWASMGDPVYLLLDCEGSGNTQNSRNRDSKLFSIAMLLSSYFVYNSKGVVDDSAINTLTLVASVCNSFSPTPSKPRFLWVLRDFVLDLTDPVSEAPISASEYLKNALGPKSTLSSFFSTIDCATLVVPILDELKLQSLDKQSWDNLRPEFENQIFSIRRKIFRDAKKLCNGYFFLNLFTTVIGCINKGDSLELNSLWSTLEMEEREKKISKIILKVRKNLDQIEIPKDLISLNLEIDLIRKETIRNLKSDELKSDLESQILIRSEKVRRCNEIETRRNADILIKELWENIVVETMKVQDGPDLFLSLVEELKQAYFDQAKGCNDIISTVYRESIEPRVGKILQEYRNKDSVVVAVPEVTRSTFCRCLIM